MEEVKNKLIKNNNSNNNNYTIKYYKIKESYILQFIAVNANNQCQIHKAAKGSKSSSRDTVYILFF